MGKSSNSSSSSRGATGFFEFSSLSFSASFCGIELRLFDCGLTFDMMVGRSLGSRSILVDVLAQFPNQALASAENRASKSPILSSHLRIRNLG